MAISIINVLNWSKLKIKAICRNINMVPIRVTGRSTVKRKMRRQIMLKRGRKENINGKIMKVLSNLLKKNFDYSQNSALI